MELKERIALVTGGGQGIGRGIAIGLAKEGAWVAVNDLSRDRAESTAQEIIALGRQAIVIPANVADAQEVSSMVSRVKGEWGRIDILVNNAGIAPAKMVEDMDKDEWDNVLDVNLGGVFNCSKAVIEIMKSQGGGGKIVCISSLAGKLMSFNAGANYTASKAAILGFTRHLAFELGPYGINVNAVCPGFTLTPLLEKSLPPDQMEAVKKRMPLRSLVTPEHVANAVVFLASDKARMITGCSIDVDAGGSLAWQDWDSYVSARRKGA
jgi:NAD(P)-dependent dehydrogenase (short-subunit alcohol dehydrogenase family)